MTVNKFLGEDEFDFYTVGELYAELKQMVDNNFGNKVLVIRSSTGARYLLNKECGVKVYAEYAPSEAAIITLFDKNENEKISSQIFS